MQISQVSSNYKYNNYKNGQKSYASGAKTSFTGAVQTLETSENALKSKFFKPFNDHIRQPFHKQYDKLTDWIAKGIGKLMDSDKTKEFVEDLIKHEKLNKNLLSHLIVTGSTILSGFYVIKTLKNENLDQDKRKTLAINQGIVWALSTVLAYTLDKSINKKIDAFSKKFEEANKGDASLAKYKTGIKAAKSIMVMGVVYRYIAPVVVTPFANYFGNKANEKKEAKKA